MAGIDTTRIPALEYELEQAKGVKGGGQLPNPGRIAAIEEELRVHRRAAGIPNKRGPKGEKETADARAPHENTDAKSPAEGADGSDTPETTAA